MTHQLLTKAVTQQFSVTQQFLSMENAAD